MSCAFWRTICPSVESIGRSSGLIAVRVSRPCWFLLGLMASAAAVPCLALTLDSIAEQSQFGQPFRIVVPIVLQPGEELSGECLNVIPSRVAATGDVPEILWARIALERAANSARLVVTNGRAINDPAMRITLEVGCDRAIRREYMILFDPLPQDVTVVDTSGTVVASSSIAPASAPSSEAAPLTTAPPTPIRAGRLGTEPPATNEHEDAFDNDVAA